MTREEYIAQEVDEAKFYAVKGIDRGGNRIWDKQAYIRTTEARAWHRYNHKIKDKR